MPETHYIEIDEEIISTVSRLRRSGAAENVFVFPKRALILQSIINLKLLAREAEKLGKTVVVMTQDDQGIRLAEKAGLKVAEYQERVLREQRKEAPARFTVRHDESIPMPEPVNDQAGLRHSDEIGSESFYAAGSTKRNEAIQFGPEHIAPQPVAPVGITTKLAQTLRVRNATPPLQTALNSKQDKTVPTVRTPGVSPLPIKTPSSRSSIEPDKKARLKRFFEPSKMENRVVGRTLRPDTEQSQSLPPTRPTLPVQRNKAAWFWLALGLVLLVAISSLSYFFLRPEAIIEIEPQETINTVKLSLIGSTTETSVNRPTVPARYIEEERTIRLSREATGRDLGNSTKAAGTIIITNSFSSASQPLVATTRFEAADGRLYRLVDSVTIPGTKTEGEKTVPGSIEARVMADVVGVKYNLDSGVRFSIPGFKGGPKFEKITAESKGAFVGGEDGAGSGRLSVSSSDLESAKAASAEEARKVVFGELQGALPLGEVVLEPSFDVALLGSPTAPTEGTTTNVFDYEARYRVRGFIISEAGVKEIFSQETVETDGVVLRPYRFTVRYSTVLSNFEMKKVDFTAESQVLFRSVFDEAQLKNDLLGRDEKGIREYLAAHPEVKRLQVEFKPKIFISAIPDDSERVTIKILDTETE